MTKKDDLLIGGWVGVDQLLVAALQTVQRSNILTIVYLLLIRLKCEFYKRGINEYCAACGNAVQEQILYREQFPERVVPNSKTFTSTVQRLRCHMGAFFY
jgi:hypothetical protein